MKLPPLEHDRYYHVYNRGNNKENIFRKPRDYDHFIRLLERYLLPIADIHSYCLLPNHYHLIVRIKSISEISEELQEKMIRTSFGNMMNAYAKSYNKKYKRSGSLFQKHLKKKLIHDESYLKNLVVYVNKNPSLHGIGDFKDYKYSSYNDLLGTSDSWLKKDYVLSVFGGKENLMDRLGLEMELSEELEE